MFVEYCMIPRQIAISNVNNVSFFDIFLSFTLNRIANNSVNINPEKHHNIKDSLGEESKIIFFKTTASQPVKKSAQNLKNMSFLNNILKNPSVFTVSKINQLPKMISNVPIIPLIDGVSPSKI